MKIQKAAYVSGAGIRLRNADVNDAEFVLSLRTDSQLNQFISPVSGAVEQQIAFLERYRESDDQAFFIIEDKDHNPVGTVRLYDQKGDSFCWGSWIVSRTAPPRTGTKSALLVYSLGFDILGFNESHFDVRKGNERVWRFHESWGAVFQHEDELDRHYRFPKDAWRVINAKYADLFKDQGVKYSLL